MHCCIRSQTKNQHSQIKIYLKVKGDGPLTYHLGADYYHDPDGTMVSQPQEIII